MGALSLGERMVTEAELKRLLFRQSEMDKLVDEIAVGVLSASGYATACLRV